MRTAIFVFGLNFLYLFAVYFAAKLYCKYETVVLDANNTFGYIKKIYKSDNTIFILVNASFTFITTTFISRLVAIIDWIIFGIYKGRYFKTNYAILRSMMPFERFDIVVGVLVALISVPLWFYIEHQKSKKSIQSTL